MYKAIGDCTVGQLMNYRANMLCEGNSCEQELSVAICVFLENPRLAEMNFQEKNKFFRQFMKSITKDVKSRMIDIE